MYRQQTKIVATIGPASDSEATLTRLVTAGLDVARINFSHGTHESNAAAMRHVRRAAESAGATVAVLADLQGPRVRTVVEKPTLLHEGMIVAIVPVEDARDMQSVARAHAQTEVEAIGFDQPAVVAALREGDNIYIEDGLKHLVVMDVRADGRVLARVAVGGEVANHKGINLPDTDVPLPALTPKDERDLAFLLSPTVAPLVDYIALSFVRHAADVEDLRERIAHALPRDAHRPGIIVKIERPEAIANLDAIVAAADGVMVARGDLATETGQENVVILQKRIIATALAHTKPVIVATQMLGSMEHAPRPTRAEIADVTNAVIDHTDAVMLSGETATGDFPVESVTTMHDIIRATEISPYDDVTTAPPVAAAEQLAAARAAWAHARDTHADAIICATADGAAARAIAHFRPQCRIIALTPDARVQRQLALVWGTEAYYDKKALRYDAAALALRGRAYGARHSVVFTTP